MSGTMVALFLLIGAVMVAGAVLLVYAFSERSLERSESSEDRMVDDTVREFGKKLDEWRKERGV